MVSLIDFIVGLFRNQLDRLGVLRVTVLVFTADKGTHHRLVSELQNMTMRGDKRAPTDTGTHGPLSVSVPGRIPGGRVLDDLIDSADVLPTPAEAAGLACPTSWAGTARVSGIGSRGSQATLARGSTSTILIVHSPTS